MGILTIIFILELITGFVAFFFVDKVKKKLIIIHTFTTSLENLLYLFIVVFTGSIMFGQTKLFNIITCTVSAILQMLLEYSNW